MADNDRKTGEGGYPRDAQNPPLDPGMRPDEQASGKAHIPADRPGNERRFKSESEMSPGEDHPMNVPESHARYDPADPTRPAHTGGGPD